MKQIRVMIVEDSPVVRELLCHIIGQDPRLTVAAAVDSGENALKALHRVSPDVISMDIRLPGMNGLETTRRIMSEKPTPIVVVSASVEEEELKISINALKAGALSIVEKPMGHAHSDYAAMAERICTQLAIMSQVKVIRQRKPESAAYGKHLSKPGQATSSSHPVPAGPFRMMGVVASTGGPKALNDVFLALPRPFPLPILLVQHITPAFLQGFVSWLEATTSFPCLLAEAGVLPKAGHVYVAPANSHLGMSGGRLVLLDTPPVHAQKPAGTILFESMAAELGEAAIGVLLTGMGEDGARGLLAMREKGGYTLAEDESTAAVYGMPRAAVELGAACECLPLPQVAPRIAELVGMRI